ncbi:MAG: beta-ketoacyl synthase N-terminal-like domain-containing protein, partial [Acidobacteria bacterium]|nr:beta-ketoacyl synthase N-terminal-like domain-containing protein [Acidobacteriota bacterium]
MARRVVVTGIGLVTPLGADEDVVWGRLMAGATGLAPLTAFDTEAFISPYKVKIAAQVDDELVVDGLHAMGRRPMDRALDLALVAGDRALRQAHLIDGEPPYTPLEAPVIMGTGIGSAQSIYDAFQRFSAKGPKGLLPTSVPRIMPNS